MTDPNATDPNLQRTEAALKAVNAEGINVLQKLAGSKWGGAAIIVWTILSVAAGKLLL